MTSPEIHNNLEPRVVKLEASLDILTRNVTDLSNAVRENATNLDNKLERLTVAVTQAQAPQKTDWSMIISAVFLVLAIGSAVFWPLNQTSTNNKIEMQTLSEKFDDHNKLQLHPVGGALVQRLEDQLKIHIDTNQREMTQHILDAKEMHSVLDKNIQTQLSLVIKDIKTLEVKQNIFNDKIYSRVIELEKYNREQISKDNDELRNWRLQAMQKSVNNLTPPTPVTIK